MNGCGPGRLPDRSGSGRGAAAARAVSFFLVTRYIPFDDDALVNEVAAYCGMVVESLNALV